LAGSPTETVPDIAAEVEAAAADTAEDERLFFLEPPPTGTLRSEPPSVQ
jgi:hypothetical protein